MKYHVLNGDALAEKFPAKKIPGQMVVIREAFMDGPLTTNIEDEKYWLERAQYIADTYNEDQITYFQKFLHTQLVLLNNIKSIDQVYLWFEDDLFCQVNMWFVVYYITRSIKPQFYRVFPEEDISQWKGFGTSDGDELETSYSLNKFVTLQEAVQ